jgi:hypothetical protein
MVRCKMFLIGIEEQMGGGKKYRFMTVYDGSIPEDQRFAEASPSGMFEVQINNPVAQAFFELGKAYYFDAHPAQAPSV